MVAANPSVLITGASSGIGAAACHVFAQARYNVILAARRKDRLAELAAALRLKTTARILDIECDVCSDSAVNQLYRTVTQEFGSLNVLVNNAGYGQYGSVEATPPADFQKNMDTNVLGSIRCVQGALPLLRRAASAHTDKRWGAAIVMVSSIVGRRSMPMLSSYCATKFAMEALCESLRVELWDERISVSVVNPGVTRTEFGEIAKGDRPSGFLSFDKGMDPAAVARIILKAARGPFRNRYLTMAGKAGVLLQWLSPSLFDRILLHTWRKSSSQDAQLK